MFRAFAYFVIARSCSWSITALRSANLPCRALLPKNRSPASALRSWRATCVMVRTLLVAALLSISSCYATAAMILGPGVASCGTWTEDRHRSGGADVANQAWVLGYLS